MFEVFVATGLIRHFAHLGFSFAHRHNWKSQLFTTKQRLVLLMVWTKTKLKSVQPSICNVRIVDKLCYNDSIKKKVSSMFLWYKPSVLFREADSGDFFLLLVCLNHLLRKGFWSFVGFICRSGKCLLQIHSRGFGLNICFRTIRFNGFRRKYR